jgi:hypothetical protein
MRSPTPAARLAGPALLLLSALPGPAGDAAFVGALVALAASAWALARVARHRRSACAAAGLATLGSIGLALTPGVLGAIALVAGTCGVLAVLAWDRQVSVLEPVLALLGLGVVVLDRGLVVAGALLVAVALARGPEMPGTPVPERLDAPPGR